MRSLLLIFALLLATPSPGVASPYQKSALDYLIQLAANECTEAGQTICRNECNMVMLCVSDGQGGFDEVELATCIPGSTKCSAEEGRCVSGSTACGASEGGSIECHATGYFPDPYDCTVYHICLAVNANSIAYTCTNGYAYNALTNQCSSPMTGSVCTDGPVPACTREQQTGALPANPNIYYVCTSRGDTLVPLLYRCPDGEIYDYTLPGCYDPRSSTTSTSTSTSTTTTSSTTTTTTTPSPGSTPPTPGGPCWPPLLIVADPDDCTRYYECSRDGRWLHVACVHGTYFNPVHNRCELGWC